MIYLLIVLILLVALAPVVWMKSSPRQQLIASFRQAATRKGIAVTLCSAPDAREGEGGLDKAQYAIHWPTNIKTPPLTGKKWLLVHNSRRGDPSPWQGWNWLSKPCAPQYLPLLEEVVHSLSNDVCGFSVDQKAVAFYWGEKGAIADLEANIEVLKKLHKRLLS